jgi:hypothetical protein
LSGAELLCGADNLAEFLQLLALLVNEQLGIPHNIDEKNVPDFQFDIGRGFLRHEISSITMFAV